MLKQRISTAVTQSRTVGQNGFTLIELMISIVISMTIVIAASYFYLNSRETQRALSEKASLFENARFVMDVLGRDIENAGFYPTIRVNTGAGSISEIEAQQYQPPATTSAAPFQNAVFGCAGVPFQPTTSTCGSTSTTNADTLVINYYTNDASGLDVGQRSDCLRSDVALDPVNVSKRNANYTATGVADRPFLAPIAPLFVSNRYSLVTTSGVSIEGNNIAANTLFSFSCNGNGTSTATNGYQPLTAGINQLVFSYYLPALMPATSTSTGQYLNAASMQTLASATTDPNANPWKLTTAIKVCILARSIEAVRLQGSAAYTMVDCNGTTRTFTDGIERRTFTQVFALKNKLNEIY